MKQREEEKETLSVYMYMYTVPSQERSKVKMTSNIEDMSAPHTEFFMLLAPGNVRSAQPRHVTPAEARGF